MANIFKVVFFLRGKVELKGGNTPIDIRIYLRNERLRVGATGYSIDTKLWDSKRGRVIGRSADAIKINNELDRIESDLIHLYRQNEFADNLSLDLIRAEYTGEKIKSASFIAFYQEYLKQLETEVGVKRSYASFQKYGVLLRHFIAFIKEKYNRKDFLFSDLSYRVIVDFEAYLTTKGKCSHNTTMKMMGTLKTMTTRAQKFGLLDRDPFINYKMTFKKVDRGFLTDEEIQVIMDKKIDIPRLALVRDIFIFSCFTGLAYIDVAHLTPMNIRIINGKKWIITRREKTDVDSNILLLEIPEQIIDKYKGVDPNGRLLPVFSNQKVNSYLKEIAAICGLDRNLTFHLARHTFATMSLTKGVPIESVSKMLGHANIRTTQIYARIISKKIEIDMLDLSTKLDDFDVHEITSSKVEIESRKPSRFDEPKPPMPADGKDKKKSGDGGKAAKKGGKATGRSRKPGKGSGSRIGK